MGFITHPRQGSVTEDKASSSHVVVPIPTSLEEGEATNIQIKQLAEFCLPCFCLLMLLPLVFGSRGVGAPCDEERQTSAATLGVLS